MLDRDVDPLHDTSGPSTSWTTVNIGEAMPGVPTPLTWTYYSEQTERSLRDTFYSIGALARRERPAPDVVDERFTAIFHGHPVLNLDMFHRMGARMPGTSPSAVEGQLFGTAAESTAPDESEPRRYPVVAAKFPVAAIRSWSRVVRNRRQVDTWWRSTIAGIDSADPRALVAHAQALHEKINTPHAIATMVSQGLYDKVTELCRRAGEPDLVGPLLISARPEEATLLRDLWRLSRGELALPDFLAEHGYHGPNEGELASPTWREEPAALDAVLAAYRARSELDDPGSVLARRFADRERAERTLLRQLSARVRPGARALLWTARKFLPLREIGRPTFLRADDVARSAVRLIGSELASAGIIADPADAFFLTVGEVLNPAPPNLVEQVDQRRRQHKRYREVCLPVRWTGPIEPPRHDPGVRHRRLTGIGTSLGVVEGVAVVITDHSLVDLEPGSILVANTTDPSWSALFVCAAGVVVDIGGHLSHGAIVARDLGIPCVMNTKTGTRDLRTGDRIRVDGNEGTVTVLDEDTREPKA